MRERPLQAVVGTPLVELDRRIRALPIPAARRIDHADVDALALAAIGGDAAAVGRLYDQLVVPIYRYVALRVRRREDAEDITQLVFERIVAGLPRYRARRSPFAAWAFRIARNAVIDHVRRERPVESLTPTHDRPDGVEIEALSLRGEQIRELREAIGFLTLDQQEALVLRFVAGLSAEEAAAAMGRRAGTIRGLTFRAIGALRRQLVDPNAEAEP
jgi:RNA polymerase sigma-70 factor, ECF subfamily